MKTLLLPLLALPGFFLWNAPAQAQPYRFFPNVNPGIQRSIIIPQSDSGYGYGRAPYPVHRGGGYGADDYYGRPSRETTIINGGNNCFNCRSGDADYGRYGRHYRGWGGYGRGNVWR